MKLIHKVLKLSETKEEQRQELLSVLEQGMNLTPDEEEKLMLQYE